MKTMTRTICIPVLIVCCVLGLGLRCTFAAEDSQAEKKTTYYENGSKRTEGTYKNGQLDGPFIEFYPNGAKSMEGQFKNGKYDGEWLYWYDDGKLRGKGGFKDGLRTGTHIFWHKTGEKLIEVAHKNGKFHGEYKEYNPEGKLLEVMEFNEGVREGKCTQFHENGKKALEGQHTGDKRNGKWISWDKQGERFSERVYKDGEVVSEDKELHARTLAGVSAEYEIMLPRDFSPERKYPLVLMVHGRQGGILEMKISWKADQLKEIKGGYIFAFLQSSQPFETYKYNWDKPEIARRDIRQLYDEIRKKYPIDDSRVIIVGTSQGGQVAIDAAINQIVPVSGFLACCPSKPESLDREMVKQAVQKGVRGTILAGERDKPFLPVAKELDELFTEMKLEHRFIIIPGMGHSIPTNSTEHILNAFAHIFDRES